MLEFALSQETARTAPLLPPVEGREENLLFRFVSVSVSVVPFLRRDHLLKKEQFPFPPGSQVHGTTVCDALPPHSRPRPILPVAKRVRFGDVIPPHAPLASPVQDPGSLLRMPQNAPPSVPSTPTPFRCTTTGTLIVPLEPLAQHLEAWLMLPSLSRWLTRTIRLGYAIQFARRPPKFNGVLETSVAVRNAPVLRWGDCCPPGKGCNRAGPSSRDEAGDLQPLLHRTQERWWPSANPGSVSLEPGFAQAPVQDADAQTHDQMHSAPGLVCSDRPEGRLLSRFDPSATQTVSTVCVRRLGMAVQGPPLRALPVSPCVHEGCRGRPYPVTGSGRQDPQLPRRLAYSSPIQRAVGRSQGLGAPAPQPVGASGQLGKEQALPCAENLFSRCGVRLGEYDGTPHGGSSFRGRNVVPLKPFQRLLGHMASAAAVTPLGLLHMRPLQHWLHSRVPRWAWRCGTLRVGISQQCSRSLSPWTDLAFLRARVPLEQVSRHTVVTTDASSTGWGATCNRQAASGLWTGLRLLWHINCLELWAVHLALWQFRLLLLVKHVLVRTDNTTAVSISTGWGVYVHTACHSSPAISSSGVTRSSSHCVLFTSRGSSIVRPTRSLDSSRSPGSGDSIPRRSGWSGVDSGKLR